MSMRVLSLKMTVFLIKISIDIAVFCWTVIATILAFGASVEVISKRGISEVMEVTISVIIIIAGSGLLGAVAGKIMIPI